MQRNQKRCFLLPQFVIQWVGVLVVAFAAFGAHAAPKAVRVVSDNNYPPYLFLGPDGQPRGYIVDLWKLWEKKTGIHVDLEPMQWSAAQAAMRGGNADVVDMIFDTPERDGLYRFSPPYSTQTVGIYVDHTIQGIRDPRSLRGFQVGVERGDACVDKLHHLGIDNLSLYPNYQAILAAAQSGAIKIFCMDDEPANYYLYLSRNQLRFAKAFTLYTDGFRWATRLGDDAMFALIMQGMKQIDGRERDALRRRWFTQPVQFLPYARLAAAVVLASLGALSALALWIWSLRRAVRSKTAALHDRNDALVRQACELVDEHARLRALIESSPDAMWLKERGGAYIDCNAKAAEFMGRAREEIIGHVIDELGNNDVLIAGIRQIDRRVWDTRSMQRGEFTIISPADVTCDIEIIKVPIFAPDGEITGVLGVARDITERRRAERELRIAAVAFESQDGIVISDARDLIQRVNTAFTELTGYCAEEIVGSNASSLLGSEAHSTQPCTNLDAAVCPDESWSGPVWLSNKAGEPILVRIAASAVRDECGGLLHVVRTLHDITAETAANERAERLARFDPLTNLPNRRVFERHIAESAIEMEVENPSCSAVLLIGLDDFATINNIHGHKVGDQILQQAAGRIRSLGTLNDTLARFGGDLFAVHLARMREDLSEAAEEARQVADDLRHALGETYAIAGGRALTCTASIGVTLIRGRPASADALLAQAEIAMYKAKDSGKNAVKLFEPEMQKEIDARNTLANEIRAGLAVEQFVFYYQPQVDVSGEIVGAEALLRWKHPRRGLVLPDEFIPLAEQTGLIEPLGTWAIREACRQLATWATMPLARDVVLAVNISARQLRRADFAGEIQSALVTAGANPTRLKLEITESMVVENIDDVIAKLEGLKRQGLRISLDDFGTGVSSLSYLTRLPLDEIKIDKSFVRTLPGARKDALVVQSIIGMAHAIGLDVVAEGVETKEQYQFLTVHDCRRYQGYLFSKPLPQEEFTALLEDPI